MNHIEAWDTYQNLTYEQLPTEVVTVANQCVLDWFGCAVVGSTEPLAEILRGQFGQRLGVCSVVGSDLKLEAPTAALLNGASGHALDYDDTGSRTLCHSTAPVLPAALAIAEEIGATGEQLVCAFVVGVEVLGRISLAMGSDHYARGWHTTATFGTFGATAAVCHLLGLNKETYCVAMGLAASHAGGVKANFGTMTKPFHPGRAAESGVNCARLAAAGLTANPDAVLGNQGFVQAASNAATTAKKRAAKSPAGVDDWMILGTLFKYHAACHLTHSSIESVLTLKAGLAAQDLSSLTITVHPSLLDVCGIPNPQTGLEGKFSLRGTASLALQDFDTSDPGIFVDTVISGSAVQSFIPKIKVETDASLGQFQSKVVWVDNRQASHEAFNDLSDPVTDFAAQGRKLEKKFESLCALAAVDSGVARLQVKKLAGDAVVLM